MKNAFVKTISLLLCAASLVCFCTVGAGAAINDVVLYGDVNYDYEVEIDDVTRIQRFLCSMISFNGLQQEIADYDHDGEVTARDATYIQRALAQATIPESYGGYFHYYANAKKCYADYSSGKAMAGVPVTFTTEGGYPYYKYEPDDFFKPVTYTYTIYQYQFVDGHSQRIDIAQETVVDAPLTYTFEEAGSYTVSILACDRLDNQSEFICSYNVVEPYSTDKPVIASVYSDKPQYVSPFGGKSFATSCYWKDMTLSVNAIGGSGDYEYAFELTAKDETITQDYSTSNSFVIDSDYFPGWAEYNAIKAENNAHWDDRTYQRRYYDESEVEPFTLKISVRDSAGDVTTETVAIEPIKDFDYVA